MKFIALKAEDGKRKVSTAFCYRMPPPPTKPLSGTSLVTTAPAATTTLLPMVIPGRAVTLTPSQTSLPNVSMAADALTRISENLIDGCSFFCVLLFQNVQMALDQGLKILCIRPQNGVTLFNGAAELALLIQIISSLVGL